MKEQRVGVFGGTFNPPHCGHLLVAEIARDAVRLDSVLFIPAYQPPHKVGREIIDARHRLAMTKLAVKGNRQFHVNDIEIKNGGISYTVQTLMKLEAIHPDASLFLIIGSDTLAEYHNWRDPEKILQIAQLVVYPRERNVVKERGRDAEFLRGPICEISSTEIRGRVARGESIRYMVDSAVERYIKTHRLYT